MSEFKVLKSNKDNRQYGGFTYFAPIFAGNSSKGHDVMRQDRKIKLTPSPQTQLNAKRN